MMKQAMGPLIGHSLLLTDGAVHQRQRKLVSPAFHFRHLKGMMPGMVSATAAAMDDWLAQLSANQASNGKPAGM